VENLDLRDRLLILIGNLRNLSLKLMIYRHDRVLGCLEIILGCLEIILGFLELPVGCLEIFLVFLERVGVV